MPRGSDTVWEHFLLLSESDGKKLVLCNYCNMQYKFAQATRLKQHILKCKNCPDEMKKKFNTDKIYNCYNVTKIPVLSPTPRSIDSMSTASTSSAATTWTENTSTSLDLESTPREVKVSCKHADVDALLARAIYASGVPLSLLESEYWQDVFKVLDPSYTVPSRHALSNHLLETEYMRIKKEIDNKLTKSMALGLMCDGWINVGGKQVINFIITTPKQFFYNAIFPERVTAQLLSEQMIKIIEEVGPSKFVAVITDNATNMKAAWENVTAKFPHIACVGCVSHTLNLIYTDIFKLGLFKEVLHNIVSVIRYIKRAHIILALFEKFQVEKYGPSTTSLALFSKTRWSGAYITLNSYKENREALELLAICHETDIAPQIQSIILNSQIWIKIDEVIKVLKPMARAILISENNSALLSDVPYIFNSLGQEVTRELETAIFLSEPEKNDIMSSIQKRKDSCLKPIHYAAHQLDPRYCGVCLSDDEICTVSEYLRQVSKMFYIEDAEVLKNMSEFRLKENFFDENKAIWAPVNELEPRLWWKTFASNVEIANIAIKILSVPPSITGERNLNLFPRSHTKIRNRLSNSRLVKLMSIRSHLGLFRKETMEHNAVHDLAEYIDDDTSDSECEISDRDPL